MEALETHDPLDVREEAWVRCVNNDAYPASLEVGKKYWMLPNSKPQIKMARVMDESGEDYLFPQSYFEPVEPGEEPDKTDTSREWIFWGFLGFAAVALVAASRAARQRHPPARSSTRA